jgi:NADP-dependent 3-hydroxy acid dehydrogenase YdfG
MTHRSTALVTGASAGFGLALARSLIDGGWRVIGTARRVDRLARLGSELGEAFLAVPGDITDPAHRAELAEVASEFGQLDLLVNNASSSSWCIGPMSLRRWRFCSSRWRCWIRMVSW